MPLDPVALATPETPEWWMRYMASLLLDRYRTTRLARLAAYRAGCPPVEFLSTADRRGFYQFQRVSRTNMARKVVRSKGSKMRVRSIRTAVSTDDLGDQTAWSYWMRSGLTGASKLVHSDMLTFNEGYVRVSVTPDGTPVALRRDPWSCIAIPDPLDPLRTLVGFELLWDQITGVYYAYLWMRGPVDDSGQSVGQQWVAVSQPQPAPRAVPLSGVPADEARRLGLWWPRLYFDAEQFTMRPNLADIDPADRDNGPYSQTFPADVVPLFKFTNREDVGEYEEHTDVLDRINRTILTRVVTQAIQAYKQRALEQQPPQPGMPGQDMIPRTDPKTGQAIDWDAIFQPGPDAMWKLPPGVKIWESGVTDSKPMLDAAREDLRTLSLATDTLLSQLSDDVNQSAEGAQVRREDQLAAINDCTDLAGPNWAQVVACMFLFAPDADRYVGGGRGKSKIDRAEASQILIDWEPPERFSLSERADADSKNKTLSLDDAARVIWGLPPWEVAANRERRKKDMAELPMLLRLSQLPPGLSDNEVPPAVPAGSGEAAPAAPEAPPAPTA